MPNPFRGWTERTLMNVSLVIALTIILGSLGFSLVFGVLRLVTKLST